METLEEKDYKNFITAILQDHTKISQQYQNKVIKNPIQFQRDTNVGFLCRLFSCCTSPNKIGLDNIVRKKIDTQPAQISCKDIIEEYGKYMRN